MSTRDMGRLMTPREVGVALGLGKTAVARLIFLGRECKGRHPLWGGLWPVFKLGRARRVAAAAVSAHLAHVSRLEGDEAARIVAEARASEAKFGGAAARYRGFANLLDGLKESKAGAMVPADGLRGGEAGAKRAGVGAVLARGAAQGAGEIRGGLAAGERGASEGEKVGQSGGRVGEKAA